MKDVTAAPAAARTRRTARTVGVSVASVLLLLIAVGVVAQNRRQPVVAQGLTNAPPNLTTPSLRDRPAPDNAFPLPLQKLEPFGSSEPVDVATLLGQPLVINFWASWCAPCVREMPELKRAADQLKGRVAFLGVDVMDSPANAEPFIKSLGIDYALASDPTGAYWRATNSFGMPTTLLVRPDGTVVYRHTGDLDAEQLLQLIREHLDVATAAD